MYFVPDPPQTIVVSVEDKALRFSPIVFWRDYSSYNEINQQ